MTSKLEKIIKDLKSGKPIILVDDLDRENEGDLVVLASKANKENLKFLINKGKGLMCIATDSRIIDRLDLKPMTNNSTDKNGTPFTISVDAALNTTTGMSIDDRLETIKVFINNTSSSKDLNKPGHLFPLRANEKLLLGRRGHTEGAVLLARFASEKPVAIIVEIMNEDCYMMKGAELKNFAKENNLNIISIEELVPYSKLKRNII